MIWIKWHNQLAVAKLFQSWAYYKNLWLNNHTLKMYKKDLKSLSFFFQLNQVRSIRVGSFENLFALEVYLEGNLKLECCTKLNKQVEVSYYLEKQPAHLSLCLHLWCKMKSGVPRGEDDKKE